MSIHSRSLVASSLLASLTMVSAQSMAQAQVEKPNIVLIVSDDFGYGDMGVYGGGENRGQPTPNLDRWYDAIAKRKPFHDNVGSIPLS